MAPKRTEVMAEPNGRLAAKFRKLSHVPFQVFLELRDVANQEFWSEWTENKKCRAGKIVSHLELKLLGALLYRQPVPPALFAAPALTSVRRCIGLFS